MPLGMYAKLADFERERDEGNLGVLLLNEFGIMATHVLCVETVGVNRVVV